MAEFVKKLFENKSTWFFQFNFYLKDQLVSVVKHFVGVFPTGIGIVNVRNLILDIDSNTRHVSIVISPLKSLMIDQYQHNLRHGISAAVIKRKEEMSTEVIQGIYF